MERFLIEKFFLWGHTGDIEAPPTFQLHPVSCECTTYSQELLLEWEENINSVQSSYSELISS